MRVLRVRGFALLLAGQAISETGNWIAVIAIWGFASFQFDVGAGRPRAAVRRAVGAGRAARTVARRAHRPAGTAAHAAASPTCSAWSTRSRSRRPTATRRSSCSRCRSGLIEAMATASLDAIPPRLVPDDQLVTANALLGGAQDVAIVVGPLAAAAVNSQWGLEGAFLADAATFLVGRAGRAAHPHRAGAAACDDEHATSTWRELRDGLSLARRIRGPALDADGGELRLPALGGVRRARAALRARRARGSPTRCSRCCRPSSAIGLVLTGLVLAVVGERIAPAALRRASR